jgi:small subunit ribosomal protein S17
MQKTVVVAVEANFRHPLYKKTVRRVRRFMAHDEAEGARAGDRVRIIESNPVSRHKRWRVIEVLTRAELPEVAPESIDLELLGEVKREEAVAAADAPALEEPAPEPELAAEEPEAQEPATEAAAEPEAGAAAETEEPVAVTEGEPTVEAAAGAPEAEAAAEEEVPAVASAVEEAAAEAGAPEEAVVVEEEAPAVAGEPEAGAATDAEAGSEGEAPTPAEEPK